MIFRRIKAHVAKEDWFAVFIDFIIVVFGVFMGFQVNNWNEARQDKHTEIAIIGYLIDDIDRSLPLQMKTQSAVQEYFDSTVQISGILHNGGDTDLDLKDIQRQIVELGPWFSSPFVTATLDEIYATGSVSTIRSKGVRDALGRFQSGLTIRDKAFQNIGSMLLEHEIVLHDQLSGHWQDGTYVLDTSLVEMADLPIAISRIDSMGTSYAGILDFHGQALERSKELRAVLSEYQNTLQGNSP